MSTETFHRLPAEKRTRILESAWAEFTRVKFADASINQIVRQAGIPRGSFYQYFTGKEDLFSCILKDVRDQFVEVYGGFLVERNGDIFAAVLDMFDHVSQRENESWPMMNRCLRILEINPGLDLKQLMADNIKEDLPAVLLENMDVSRLHRQDSAYVRQVFLLALVSLVGAIMDIFLRPGWKSVTRGELEAQLEIIKYGSLQASVPSNT